MFKPLADVLIDVCKACSYISKKLGGRYKSKKMLSLGEISAHQSKNVVSIDQNTDANPYFNYDDVLIFVDISEFSADNYKTVNIRRKPLLPPAPDYSKMSPFRRMMASQSREFHRKFMQELQYYKK